MSKTFSKMSEVEADSVLLVDSLNLAFRWKHQGAVYFLDDYVKTVNSFKRSFKCEQVVILADWGSSSYRKNIYPEYKQNRKDKQDLQSPEEAAYFQKFLEEYTNILEHYTNEAEYPVLRFKGVEADDTAAHIVNNKTKYGFSKITLLSSDRDWDLLVQDNVSRYSYVTQKEVTIDNWSDHYDVSPEEYISMKCLMGDSGDNVPGVLKVGPVTAAKLIKQYGTTLDIASSIPLPGKYVYIKNLNEFGADNLIRNYQLMDLVTFCDDAIGEENIKEIKNVFTI